VTAVVIGAQSLTWRELDDRAARLATALEARGGGVGTRVAQLMYNCPEYLESTYAAFKMRATPINVNYRYKAAEIAYICANAGAEALVFHGSLGPQVADAVADMPTVQVLLQVDDGTPLVEGAEWYHEVLAASAPAPRIERSGEDTLMLYTGGTTGNPKGVVWRHVDLFGALAFTAYASAGIEVPTTPDDVGRIAAESGVNLNAGEKHLQQCLLLTPGKGEPSHAAVYWRLGNIQERRYDSVGARAHYKHSLQIDPNFQQTLESLAKLK